METFYDVSLSGFSASALGTARKIGSRNDAALGVECFELVATLLAFECCFSFKV
jgi:hypothetical protein